MLSGPTNTEHTYVQTVWQASTMVSCNKLMYLHHDNPDKPMYLHRELRLCIKVGRGHRDACVGTWDLGTRDEGLEDIKYGTRGRQIQGIIIAKVGGKCDISFFVKMCYLWSTLDSICQNHIEHLMMFTQNISL